MQNLFSRTISSLSVYLRFVKFEHTLFALPFAFLGAIFAQMKLPDLVPTLLILLGMVGARTAAMSFNRIVDLPFDRLNPRTKNRELVTGEMNLKKAWFLFSISVILYFLSAYLLNKLALILSPLFLAIILFYSYTKRFTKFCHIFLGLAVGLSPIAGWVAINGSLSSITPFLLMLGVMFWVAGFDILYACLDYEFDTKIGLHSIPAKLGIEKAFQISSLLHSLSLLCFVWVGIINRMGIFYYIGMIITFILMVAQRRIISPTDLSRMNTAFFNYNASISMVIFLFTIMDILI